MILSSQFSINKNIFPHLFQHLWYFNEMNSDKIYLVLKKIRYSLVPYDFTHTLQIFTDKDTNKIFCMQFHYLEIHNSLS